MKEYESQILDRLYQSFPSSRKLAKRLGVSHTSIANKLREYGIKKL
jgi:transcriptional regulator of aroF, aroG, tyrA and aromatic amino acid transport